MNRLKTLSLVCLLIVAAFFTACDDKEEADATTQVKLLETISWNGNIMVEFEYNEQNRISKIMHYEGNVIRSTETYVYNSDGDMISVNYLERNGFSETSTFEKVGNKIIANGDEES